jgi:hypothetical protein
MDNCPGTFSTHKDSRWKIQILTCNYCGSITVADAIKFLKQPGTHFSGSDWKYGWPHKFYIEPANPDAEDVVPCGSMSSDGSKEGDYWTCWAHGDHLNGNTCTCPKDRATGCWHSPIMGTFPRIYCKFYNVHLITATDEEVKEFGELSYRTFGILWGRDENGIFYRAPKTNSFYGYQRDGFIKENGEVEHQL